MEYTNSRTHANQSTAAQFHPQHSVNNLSEKNNPRSTPSPRKHREKHVAFGLRRHECSKHRRINRQKSHKSVRRVADTPKTS